MASEVTQLTALRRVLPLILAAALASGCASDDSCRYAPDGMGRQTLKCLTDRLPGYLVVPSPLDGAAPTADERDRRYRVWQDNIDEHIMLRPSNPGFRSLCALLNTYFRKWDRLVVIERLCIAGDEYGFAMVGVRGQHLIAVTNMHKCSMGVDFWTEDLSVHWARVDAGQFRSWLAELDRARTVLPEGLFWFDNVDWPIYVLHDVKSDGTSFSFGVCGQNDEDTPQLPLDFAMAAELVNGAKPYVPIPEDDPQARGLRAAGRTYADLLAGVWASILGSPEYLIRWGLSSSTLGTTRCQARSEGPSQQ